MRELLVMLLKYWILLFYESVIVVVMILSISEYPCYKFYNKTSTPAPVNDTEQFMKQTKPIPVVELGTNVLSACLVEDLEQLSQNR